MNDLVCPECGECFENPGTEEVTCPECGHEFSNW